jgi:hypothetical protein
MDVDLVSKDDGIVQWVAVEVVQFEAEGGRIEPDRLLDIIDRELGSDVVETLRSTHGVLLALAVVPVE